MNTAPMERHSDARTCFRFFQDHAYVVCVHAEALLELLAPAIVVITEPTDMCICRIYDYDTTP